jgi:hypothetical protein
LVTFRRAQKQILSRAFGTSKGEQCAGHVPVFAARLGQTCSKAAQSVASTSSTGLSPMRSIAGWKGRRCSQDQLACGLTRLQRSVRFSQIRQPERANLWGLNGACLYPLTRSSTAACRRSVRGKRNDRLNATTPLFSLVMDKGLKRGIVNIPNAALR